MGACSLSLAARHPERVDTVISLAGGLGETTLHSMLNFEQKLAIFNDPNFRGRGDYYESESRCGWPWRGSSATKPSSRCGHRTREREEKKSSIILCHHPVESYFWHQGEKLVVRFDPKAISGSLNSWSN